MTTEGVDYCKTCFHKADDHRFAVDPTRKDPCEILECDCDDFVIGETRVTSATGASKGTKDARYDLIPIPALELMAKLYGFGAKKYAAHNWRKGYEWSLSYAAAMRHMTQFWAGEDIDPETGIPHVICASFHMFALATFMQEHPELDDRFETSEKESEEGSEPSISVVGMRPQSSDTSLSYFEIEKAAEWLAAVPVGIIVDLDTGEMEGNTRKIFDRASELFNQWNANNDTV